MKVIVQSMDVSHGHHMWDPSARGGLGDEILGQPEISAKIILVGDPREAQELMRSHRELEIRPAERFEKEDKKRETFDDIKKGDEIKYQFIRGAQGMGPELSQWMKVIAVDGDMITAVFSQEKYQNKYEFRVLRCQVVAHTPVVKRKIKASAQERIDVPKDGGCQCGAPNKYFVDFCDVCRPLTPILEDPNAGLRRKVLEFNLE